MRYNAKIRICNYLLIFCLLFQLIPVEVTAAPNDDQITATPFSINYDPNDGMIKYGHSGDVGFRPENDYDNFYDQDDKVFYFPDDVINEKDGNGNLMFPDYDPNNAYYDYTAMFNRMMVKSGEKGNIEVFIKPGVYYFTGSVYLNDGTNLNAVAGETAFVIKPNFVDKDGNPVDNTGFITNPNLNNTYAWYQGVIKDLIFVVEGTHDAFKPTSSVQTIMDNLCSDDVNAIKNFDLFYRVRTKYTTIDNIALSGFYSFMHWTFPDMLTRVRSVTVGPTRCVYYGVQTNDAFFYDCYYYGGYFTQDDLSELPVFQHNFSMGTTVFSNSYIGNYYFSRSAVGGCWCPHTTYSNLTLERVYNFVIDSTVTSSSVSGCYFKNGAYNDIKAYFESKGLKPYDHTNRYWDREQNKWIYPDTGYIIQDTVLSPDENIMERKSSANHWNGQKITYIELNNGTAFTQNKIECDSLDWTNLVVLPDSAYHALLTKERGSQNVMFTDNAFKIREWNYENIMVDDWNHGRPYTEGWKDYIKIVWGERGWNNSDGTPAMGWVGREGDKPVCWLKDGVYVSTEWNRYIDLSAFLDKNKASAGYAALGEVGADEQALWDAGFEDQYYNDLKSGNFEKVYFVKDFGGISWNTGSNYQKLQEAFDYVATHDAILYFEPGTYYTDKPIVLRGDATYRVVFEYGAIIKPHKTTDMDGTGIFVMSADDNAPIDGYFIDFEVDLVNSNTSAFHNVNTDGMYLKPYKIYYGVSAFHNCKLKNTVIHEGAIQHANYGFFYKTVTDNVLVKNVYGTGSNGTEGTDGYSPGDQNYKYIISSSDFANSTMRGCWLEFSQFSNGKTLTGAGNSVYRGNIIDYSYNYSFGKNDVVCGNTMIRACYSTIVNHMLNSNHPLNNKPDILTDKPMIFYHVSDGLRLIGNTDLGSMSPENHFIEFDSPSISYKDENGNIVKSISNVRIAGNVVYTATRGEYKQPIPITPFDKADNVVFENCKNNQILLHSWYLNNQVDAPETEEAEIPFTITKDEVIGWSIPGVKTYVNGEYVEIKEPTAPAVDLEQVIVPQPEQDKIYDIPNKWLGEGALTEYELYDFKGKTEAEAEVLANKMAGYIDNSTIVNYLRSQYNVASFNGEEKTFYYGDIKDLSQEERYEIFAQTIKYGLDTDVSGRYAFFMDGSKDERNTNDGSNKNRPTYAIIFRDDNISGDGLVGVETSFYYDFRASREWSAKRPIFIILSEDDENYYGFVLGYGSGNDGITTGVCSYKKDYFNQLVDGRATQNNNFPQYHFENGISYNSKSPTQLSHIDPISNITRPVGGEYEKTVLGDYTDIPMFGGIVTNYPSVVLGVDLTCEYDDDYNTVLVYATFDFSNIGEDTSQNPPLKATTRKVWLGTFDIQGDNKVFGLWTGDKTWLESVQFEYVPVTASACEHEYENKITREKTCTKDGVVKKTCIKCGYDYEESNKANGHTFWDKALADGKTLRTCSICEFSFITMEEAKYECTHKYEKTLISKENCTMEGTVNYTCSICGDSYTETISATGHTYTSTIVPPTAGEQGYTQYTCSKCGDTYKEDLGMGKEDVTLCFTDIPSNAWYVKAVQYVYDNGIMAGKGDVFCPNNPITREEVVQVLYNQSGKPAVAIENRFPDVKDAWYKNAVLWADDNDIANGKGTGMFGVGENISRQDLALMLYKYARLKDFDLTVNTGEINKYADGNKVSGYAKEAMDWAITQGIMSGKGNKGEDISTYRLDPLGTATRAECASMMMKLLEK